MRILKPTGRPLSDASLVELSLAGDRNAFGQMVSRYQSPICQLAVVIGENPPGNVKEYLEEYHERSLFNKFHPFWESSGWSYGLWVTITKDNKTTRCRTACFNNPPDAMVAQFQQRGIVCETLRQGRDFEVLGTPGRMLIFLAAFVLGMGVLYLITGRSPGTRS